MRAGSERLQRVLDGYAKFLRDKDLAPPKHQPYLVRWVRDFLHCAQAHPGHTFEQALELCLAEVATRVGSKPWQIQQAAAAVRIYRYQFRGCPADDKAGAPWPPDAKGPLDAQGLLTRMTRCSAPQGPRPGQPACPKRASRGMPPKVGAAACPPGGGVRGALATSGSRDGSWTGTLGWIPPSFPAPGSLPKPPVP